jgi:hypothetical protein
MKRKVLPVLLIIVLMSCVSCATLKAKWDQATPQEKSQIIISQTQMTLKSALDGGGKFVDANPTYRPLWKEKVLPTAKLINGMLDQFIIDLDAGKAISFTTITGATAGKLLEIINLLATWGVKVSNTDWLKEVV